MKAYVFCTALIPLARLVAGAAFYPDWLGANPAEYITRGTADWTLRFLLLTLAVTSTNKRVRRLGTKGPLGNNLHIWLAGFGRAAALQMLAMPTGIAALCALHRIPHPTAKCTSYPRTGPKRWMALHRLDHRIAPRGVLHFWRMVKKDVTEPVFYGAVLSARLGCWAAEPLPGSQIRWPAVRSTPSAGRHECITCQPASDLTSSSMRMLLDAMERPTLLSVCATLAFAICPVMTTMIATLINDLCPACASRACDVASLVFGSSQS